MTVASQHMNKPTAPPATAVATHRGIFSSLFSSSRGAWVRQGGFDGRSYYCPFHRSAAIGPDTRDGTEVFFELATERGRPVAINAVPTRLALARQ